VHQSRVTFSFGQEYLLNKFVISFRKLDEIITICVSLRKDFVIKQVFQLEIKC